MENNTLGTNELVHICYSIAKEKGFWNASDNVPEKLMLIVTELAEAMEEYRKVDFNKDAFCEEIADTLIRIYDLSGFMDLDLESALKKKIEKNKNRPYLHGKTR